MLGVDRRLSLTLPNINSLRPLVYRPQGPPVQGGGRMARSACGEQKENTNPGNLAAKSG